MRINNRKYSGAKTLRQKGFSIIELLIASLLGLILLGGVIQLFLGSNQNYSLQDDLATLQEDGRFGMMFLEHQIQLGGYAFDGNIPDAIDLTTVGATTDDLNDSFTVSYNDGKNRDCNGATVVGMVNNRFFVDADGNLMCQGNGAGSNPQPLLSNVERFQVLYGVETETGCPDGVVNSYVSRTSLASNSKILSVRFALLLQSDGNVLPEVKQGENIQILDQVYQPPNDRLTRRLFQKTVYMPNAAYNTIANPQVMPDCMRWIARGGLLTL